MEEIVKELGGGIQAGALLVIALTVMYDQRIYGCNSILRMVYEMEEIVKELGGSVQTGAVSVIALAMAYGVYAGYFKQMIETFFNGLCG